MILLNRYSVKLILLVLLLVGCDDPNSEAPQELDVTIAYKTMEGIDPNLLSLDIYYNSKTNDNKPVVIWVHGGAWCIGDKAHSIENKINLFRSLEYILVSVNYRLSPFPYELLNVNRLKYPVHNIDVADAIAWVYNNIDEYGGDNNKIALIGHSSGAHLVSLTATNERFLNDVGLDLSVIKGVASIDTDGYNVVDQVRNGENRFMYTNAFGVDEQENTDASPIHNINGQTSYLKFFIAKRGTEARINRVNAFIQKLEDNNVDVTQIDGSFYSHEDINHAIGHPDDTVITPPLIDFFDSCFK